MPDPTDSMDSALASDKRAASLVVMALWLTRAARVSGGHRRELGRASRALARHAAFTGGAYVVTLALTLPLSMLVRR